MMFVVWHAFGVYSCRNVFCMKRVFMIIIAGCLSFMIASAQVMTMDECMAYAVEHSVSVGKQENVLDNAKMNYRQSVASLLPSVSASVSASTNFGRSIDPETNSYTTVSTFGNSYGLSASMPLFAGLRYVNTIRAAKVARERGYTDLQIARDRVAMEVMRVYADVLYYKGAVAIAEERLSASRNTLRQARKLYELGLKSAAEVAEIVSQEANYDYLLMEQQNNLEMAWIALREVMNYPQDSSFDVTEEGAMTFVQDAAAPVEDVVGFALANNVQVNSSELVVEEYRLHYLKAKGTWFPTISLSAGINTNYYTNLDNKAVYPSFSSQFRNNSGEYVGISMSIPIFSNLGRSASVRSSRNALRNAELELTATRNAVESEVVQAYSRMQGYGKLYNQAVRKVEASRLAYDGIAAKFEKGLVTAIELQGAATTLLQAQSDYLRSRLQYMIERRMVDYYSGIPFVEAGM